MAKRKHPRASRTKAGQRALIAEVSIINGLIGMMINPINFAVFNFLSNLPLVITEQIQQYLPLFIFPFAVLVVMLYMGKERKTAVFLAIPTVIMVAIYAFTNRYFVNVVTPQAAVSGGFPATILFPYVTIALSLILIVFGVFLLRK